LNGKTRPSRYVAALTRHAEGRGGDEHGRAELVRTMGGVFTIAAVVDHFSDAVVQNPIVRWA
jgi:hypothetical protein